MLHPGPCWSKFKSNNLTGWQSHWSLSSGSSAPVSGLPRIHRCRSGQQYRTALGRMGSKGPGPRKSPKDNLRRDNTWFVHRNMCNVLAPDSAFNPFVFRCSKSATVSGSVGLASRQGSSNKGTGGKNTATPPVVFCQGSLLPATCSHTTRNLASHSARHRGRAPLSMRLQMLLESDSAGVRGLFGATVVHECQTQHHLAATEQCLL